MTPMNAQQVAAKRLKNVLNVLLPVLHVLMPVKNIWNYVMIKSAKIVWLIVLKRVKNVSKFVNIACKNAGKVIGKVTWPA